MLDNVANETMDAGIARDTSEGRDGGHNDLLATYDCGRLLNELDWCVQWAVLYCLSKDWDRACQTLSDLEISSRGVVDEGAREEITDRFQQAKRRLTDLRASVDWTDALLHHAEQLENNVCLGSPFDSARNDVCQQILGHVSDVRLTLREQLEAACGPLSRLVIKLGVEIDRGLRPADAYRFMYSHDAAVAGPQWPALSIPCIPGDPHSQLMAAPWLTPLTLLANVRVEDGELPVGDQWASMVRVRLREMSFTPQEIAPALGVLTSIHGSTDASQTVHDLDREIRRLLGGLPGASAVPQFSCHIPSGQNADTGPQPRALGAVACGVKGTDVDDRPPYEIVFGPDVWEITWGGRRLSPLRRDIAIGRIAPLLETPWKTIPALLLISGGDNSLPPAPGDDPTFDPEALQSIRQRIERLNDEIEKAKRNGRGEAAAECEEEKVQLTNHLELNSNQWGKPRPLQHGNPATLAQQKMSQAKRNFIGRLKKLGPEGNEIAEHFEHHLRTGRLCVYSPPKTGPVLKSRRSAAVI